MGDEIKYDGLFMTVMQQCKDINLFFDSVYGFLRRNSDFFANEKAAEKVITENCAKHFQLYSIDQQEKAKKEAEKKAREEQRKKEKEETEKQKQQQVPPPEEKKKPDTEAIQKAVEQQLEKKEVQEGDKDKKEDDGPAPIGNGGRTETYIWTQTLEEVQIYIPISNDITSKMLNVKIEANTLFVQIKGQEPLVQGEWFEKIQPDESEWLITDGEIQDYKGKYIHISLEKWTGQMHWWGSILKGHATINTQKINPDPSKLSDLDGETRGTVEKMMFDMRQKQMGLPSSDELQKKDKLSEFMKAHPEMDFSKCKFN